MPLDEATLPGSDSTDYEQEKKKERKYQINWLATYVCCIFVAYCSAGTLLAHREKNFQMECEYKTTKHNLYYHYRQWYNNNNNDLNVPTFLLSRDPFCYLFSDKCKLSLLLALTSHLMNELVDLQHLQNVFFFLVLKANDWSQFLFRGIRDTAGDTLWLPYSYSNASPFFTVEKPWLEWNWQRFFSLLTFFKW